MGQISVFYRAGAASPLERRGTAGDPERGLRAGGLRRRSGTAAWCVDRTGLHVAA